MVSRKNALQWYYLETEHQGGLRPFLKCRTFGLCMAHNRLLGFHVVRATRPVVWTPGEFVPERSSRTPRTPLHMERHPEYPDSIFTSTTLASISSATKHCKAFASSSTTVIGQRLTMAPLAARLWRTPVATKASCLKLTIRITITFRSRPRKGKGSRALRSTSRDCGADTKAASQSRAWQLSNHSVPRARSSTSKSCCSALRGFVKRHRRRD